MIFLLPINMVTQPDPVSDVLSADLPTTAPKGTEKRLNTSLMRRSLVLVFGSTMSTGG
jgi:hypothetical protein